VKLLALDTATEACSAALLVGERLTSRYEVLGRGHAERLLPMVDELLAESGIRVRELDAIAFGRGPGAFTGVRIAVSVAQGLAFGASLPTVPVSDLAALARGAIDKFRATAGAGIAPPVQLPAALVCLDARMGEVYWALGRHRTDGGIDLSIERVGPPVTVDPDLPVDGSEAPTLDLIGVGHGWSSYAVLRDNWGSRLAACWPELLPHAADVARLAMLEARSGRLVPAERAEPVYLRNDVATRPGRPAT
jgi:tRNA threonylcarbamoyladenosine biosynthesis protein TsaB